MEYTDLRLINVMIHDIAKDGELLPARPLGTWYLDTKFLGPGFQLELGSGFYNVRKVYQRGHMFTDPRRMPEKPGIYVHVTKSLKQ